MGGLREAEENILECLGSGRRLLYNLAATKKLASIKKQHEEIVERLVNSCFNSGDHHLNRCQSEKVLKAFHSHSMEIEL